MKAWGIRRYGGSAALELLDAPIPLIGDDDLLVQLRAAGVNPTDFKLRNGEYRYIFRSKMPFILGHEGVGVVVDKGRMVKDFSCGDEVYFARPHYHPSGTWAEYAAVSQHIASLRPRTLPLEHVAGIPIAGLTSWQAFHAAYSLRAHDRVFIPAGAGGVGSFAIQLGKALGATIVSSASRNNLGFVKALGADEVVARESWDYRPGEKMDLVLDTLGPSFHRQAFSLLKRGGTLVSIVGPPTAASARSLKLGAHLVAGSYLLSAWTNLQAHAYGIRYRFLAAQGSRSQLGTLAQLLDSGAIHPVVDRVYEFDETPAALAHVESRHARGKVIVRMPC